VAAPGAGTVERLGTSRLGGSRRPDAPQEGVGPHILRENEEIAHRLIGPSTEIELILSSMVVVSLS
jgi:hypothetical protein